MVQRSIGSEAFANYELLAEALPHLVWFARPDGAVTYYNQRSALYGGIAPNNLGIYDWAPVVHSDDVQRTRDAWDHAVRAQEPYECEHRVRMADGSYRWHLSRALPLQTTQGAMWFGTATDTHMLVEAGEALVGSEALLRSVISELDQGFCVCELVLDDDGRPVDYRFLEANDLFEIATGLSAVVGRTAYELVPDLEPHWLETYARVALGDEPLRFQQNSPAMGRRFDVFATPVAPRGRFAVLFSDITERHAALEALAESEQRFRNMADNAPVMIWVTDVEGRCTYLNTRWYEFTGQTEEDALGHGWLDAIHRDDRAATATAFAEATRHQREFSLDFRLRRGDGTYRWAVDAAAPRIGEDGRFHGYVGSVLDITERKRAEEALAAQRDHEHDVTLRLQRSLLPTDLVQDARIEIAAAYVPGSDLQVGGDWYETFRTGDGRVGLAVGDVVGHNIEAAAAMGQIRAGMLALASHVPDPGALLCQVDQFTAEYRITDFATALCIFLDPADGTIEYASAGHPPALLCEPDEPPRWLDGAVALPLGIDRLEPRSCVGDRLEPGSVLIAYSDGLVERRHEGIDAGLERLAAVAHRHRELSPEQLCRNVLDAFAGPHGFDDDTVVLVLRYLGT